MDYKHSSYYSRVAPRDTAESQILYSVDHNNFSVANALEKGTPAEEDAPAEGWDPVEGTPVEEENHVEEESHVEDGTPAEGTIRSHSYLVSLLFCCSAIPTFGYIFNVF